MAQNMNARLFKQDTFLDFLVLSTQSKLFFMSRCYIHNIYLVSTRLSVAPSFARKVMIHVHAYGCTEGIPCHAVGAKLACASCCCTEHQGVEDDHANEMAGPLGAGHKLRRRCFSIKLWGQAMPKSKMTRLLT